jgi:hypothetical protein
MLRWIGSIGVVVVVLAVAGCGSTVKEIPPVTQGATNGPPSEDPKMKAMKGMPEEVRKKYEAQKR